MPSRSASETETISVRDALGWAMERLGGAGVETPRLDAQLLLAWAMKLTREDLAREPERRLTSRERLIFEKAVALRVERRPLPYITGEQGFYGRSFKVNRAVLIPRPETELLVDFAVAKAGEFGAKLRIADIGTGSGAIAVGIALALPKAQVIATDLSPLALNVARKNIRRHGMEGRVHTVQGDLFEPLAGKKFEIVVSNPPYVPSADRPGLMPEVRDYEPALALTEGTGPTGTALHERLLCDARGHLVAGGWIAVEVGIGQADEVRKMARSLGYAEITALADLAGIERVVAARWPG